ncbi:MAG: hypothetical protein II714_02040 [Oscillospiraceae bacterium]|nr:hypothetical protein [Oscillospiraceae bacterium]
MDIIKKGILALCAAAAFTVGGTLAGAEEFEFDTSSAATVDSWGQSFTCYTSSNGGQYIAEFNPAWITSDSEFEVEFETEADGSKAPVELIFQTWGDGPLPVNPDVKAEWCKIAPYEYDTDSAKFSYADIVDAWGTDDFSTVYALHIGDTGESMKVKSLRVTNTTEAVTSTDYVFDVSEAAETTEWGQSYTCYTAQAEETYIYNFNPLWITPDTEFQVEYDFTGDYDDRSPVELIFQTWDGLFEKNPDVKTNWCKIAPDEYDSTHARFSYQSIVDAWGTDDFTTAYAINVGDTGGPLKVTAFKATNVDVRPVVHFAADANKDEDGVTITETKPVTTRSPITTVTTYNRSEPAHASANATIFIILGIVGVIIIALIVILIIKIVKKNDIYSRK